MQPEIENDNIWHPMENAPRDRFIACKCICPYDNEIHIFALEWSTWAQEWKDYQHEVIWTEEHILGWSELDRINCKFHNWDTTLAQIAYRFNLQGINPWEKWKIENYDLWKKNHDEIVKDHQLKISQLKNVVEIQSYPGNSLYNEYGRGLANGLILALSIMEDYDPKYIDVPPEHEEMSDVKSFDSVAFKGAHAQARREKAAFREMLMTYKSLSKKKLGSDKIFAVTEVQKDSLNKLRY